MRSGFERTVAADLKRAKVRFEYESRKIPYVITHDYIPDFFLNDTNVYVETKGYFRDASEARKYKAVKAQHPDLDLRFVFMYPDRCIPGQKTTYRKWAERYGFPWAEGYIPEEWYKVS